MDIIFETEHLIIRKFKKEDAEQLYLNHREEAVKKWFPNESYIDINEATIIECHMFWLLN